MSAMITAKKTAHEIYLDSIKSVVSNLPADKHAVFTDVIWSEYQDIMDFRDRTRNNVRLVYHRGRLEIMATSFQHEKWKKMLARLFEIMTFHLGIPYKAAGNMTIDRQDLDSGFEPDECYYLTNRAAVAGLKNIDFHSNPPPDLAIESEYSRNILERLPLYALIGIQEVWRCEHGVLTILVLNEGVYRSVDRSRVIPTVTPELMHEFLAHVDEDDDNRIYRDFTERLQHLFPPAH